MKDQEIPAPRPSVFSVVNSEVFSGVNSGGQEFFGLLTMVSDSISPSRSQMTR